MNDEENGTDLLLDVVKGIGRVDREADEDDMRVGVRERPQSIVILLSGGIPEGELDLLPIDLNVCRVVGERKRDGGASEGRERRNEDGGKRSRTSAASLGGT